MPLYCAHGQTALPNTDHIGKRIMTLPISVSMKVDDVEYVVTQVKELIG